MHLIKIAFAIAALLSVLTISGQSQSADDIVRCQSIENAERRAFCLSGVRRPQTTVPNAQQPTSRRPAGVEETVSRVDGKCFRDGETVTLRGTASARPLEMADGSLKTVWILTINKPICVIDSLSEPNTPNEASVRRLQIVGQAPPGGIPIELTGKLSTGNITQYYAEATAIEIISGRQIASTGSKNVPEFISFGSRAGMEVTVVFKSGAGSAQAVIQAQLTADNAKRYCESYALDSSSHCIKEFLNNTRLAASITANCDKGTFTTFYGEKFQFVGKNLTPDSMPDYFVRNLKDGTTLDGSAASGLSYDMEQFNALCPGRSAIATQQIEPQKPDAAQESEQIKKLEPIIRQARACIRTNKAAAYQAGVYGNDQVISFFTGRCYGPYIAAHRQLGFGKLAEPSFKVLVMQEVAPQEWQRAIDDIKSGSHR